MAGLYLLGIVVGILGGIPCITGNSVSRENPYRLSWNFPITGLPGAKECRHSFLWEKAKDFLQRAFTSYPAGNE